MLQVNPAGGNAMIRQTDLRIPGGLGPDLSVARTYNSQDTGLATFYESRVDVGERWELDTAQDVRLVTYDYDDAFLFGPSGYVVRFARKYDGAGNTTNQFTTPAGFNATLVRNADGTHTLTEHGSQVKWQFDAQDRLSAQEDRNGRRITFNYDPSDAQRVSTITDSQNRDTTFTYGSDGEIDTMTDPAGREYRYTRDTSKRLTSYTDPANGVTHYEYSSQGVTEVTTPAGRVTTIEYYPSGDVNAGRVKSVTRITASTSDVDPKTSFAYEQRRDGSSTARVTNPRGGETRYVFDEQGRATNVTDALGRARKQSYTANSDVQTYTAPTNTGSTPNSTLAYDSDGNLTGTSTVAGSGTLETKTKFGATRPGGGAVDGGAYLPTLVQNEQDTASGSSTQGTGIEYDNAEGNPTLVKSTGSVAAQVSMSYDSGWDGKPGELSSTTDANGFQTTYGYDGTGNLTSITPQNSGGTQLGGTTLTYDGAGGDDQALSRITRVTDGRGHTADYTYDELDRVETLIYKTSAGAEEARFEYAYDLDGNLTQRKDIEGASIKTYGFAYDDLGRLIGETRPDLSTTTYGYDRIGNLTSLEDGGGKVEYGYDAINRMGAVFEPGVASPVDLDHLDTTGDGDPDTVDGGRSVTWRYPNGVATVNVFDQADRLTKTETKNGAGTVLQRFSYRYERGAPAGQVALRSSETDTDGNVTSYDYDSVLDRLLQAQTKNSSGSVTKTYAYTYDAGGNIRKRTVDAGTPTHYRYNPASQLCWSATASLSEPLPACGSPPSGATTYEYDASGNETSASGRRTATFNALNQMSSLTPAGASALTMDYAGPGQSRRTRQGATDYVNDALGIASGDNGTPIYYTRGENGELVSQHTPSASNPNRRHYFHPDAVGSTRALTDESGTLARRYDFDPYGREVSTGSWTASTRFRYAAGPLDSAGLYRFGERYYDPQIGRWTQQDPLDQPADLRQANRYAYVGGDPINLTDPRGTHIADSAFSRDVRRVWRSPFADDVRWAGKFVAKRAPVACYAYNAATDDEDDISDELYDLNQCFNPLEWVD